MPAGWLMSFLMYPHNKSVSEEAALRAKLVNYLKAKTAQELSPNSYRMKLLDQGHMDLLSESPVEMLRLMSNADIMKLLDRLDFLYGDPKQLLIDSESSYRCKISLFTFDPVSKYDGPPQYSILGLNDYKTIMTNVFQSSNDETIIIDGQDFSEIRQQMFRKVFFIVKVEKIMYFL